MKLHDSHVFKYKFHYFPVKTVLFLMFFTFVLGFYLCQGYYPRLLFDCWFPTG